MHKGKDGCMHGISARTFTTTAPLAPASRPAFAVLHGRGGRQGDGGRRGQRPKVLPVKMVVSILIRMPVGGPVRRRATPMALPALCVHGHKVSHGQG